MPADDDILEHMDPAVRQRIEADRSKFEPFLGLLRAWKAAVDDQLSEVEGKVTASLAEQLFPEGNWRFPAQTVAVPDDLHEREISAETAFTDPFTHAMWTPCGAGWTLPSEIVGWRVERDYDGHAALLCDVRCERTDPDAPLLTPERGQLAFVRGPEPLVAALAAAQWGVQYPDKPFEPITGDRYQGYLAFEREMAVAATAQRQLGAWLPPCHPYSRKFLHLHPRHGETRAEGNSTEWAWLEQAASFEPAEGEERIHLAALLDEATADLVESAGHECPLILNAVPVAQMGVLLQPIVATLHTVGDAYKVTFSGISSFFAAGARDGDVVHRAGFARTRTRDPRGSREGSDTLRDIDVTCDRTATEVRIYYGCLGEDSNPDREHPEYLTRPIRQRFSVPLPAVGGLNVESRARADGARSEWYHNLLRPALLTEGDVTEILSHLPSCRRYFELQQASIQLDVVNEPWIERTPWDTYLWPSIVTERSLLDLRTNYLTASRVPIVPVLRLWMQPSTSRCPAFLLDDLARYAASVLSRYFMIGWYRVEGRVGQTW